MKARSAILIAISLVSLFAWSALADFAPLKLDTVHSRISFTASTLLFDVDGHFNTYNVLFEGNPAQPATAKLKVEIDASTIDTDNSKRDKHLTAPDFLDVKRFPKITFTSTSISKSPKGLMVKGTLDLHGHQKAITIPFKVARGKNGAGMDTIAYKGKLTISRKDFGVGTDSIAAKISLEDKVEIDILLLTFP